MGTHISDLHFAKERILRDLRTRPNRRLSSLFRAIRKSDSVDGIGDWPILSMIIQVASKFKKLSRSEIWNLCKQSEEYKEKTVGDKIRFTNSLNESINY